MYYLAVHIPSSDSLHTITTTTMTMEAPEFDLSFEGMDMDEIFRLSNDLDVWNSTGAFEYSVRLPELTRSGPERD